MDICFEGIGQVVATFRVKDGENVQAGMAVTLTGNGEVSLGKEESSSLCGVTVGAARGGAVAVQIGGVVKVGYSNGETFNVGWQELVCNGAGKLTKQKSDGMKYLVLAVDKEEQTIVVRL